MRCRKLRNDDEEERHGPCHVTRGVTVKGREGKATPPEYIYLAAAAIPRPLDFLNKVTPKHNYSPLPTTFL